MATYGPTADGIEFTTTLTTSVLGINFYTVNIVDSTSGTTLDTFTNVPESQIVTTSGSTLTLASLLNFTNYFIVPGASANIIFGLSLASLPTIYVGGSATISSVASALSGEIFNVYGGTLTASSSLVAGALSGVTINLAYGGEYSNGSGLISLLNGTTINFGTDGGTFVANAGGSLLDLSSLTITGFTQGVDKIEFAGLSAPLASYTVTTVGSSQVINLYSATGAELGTVTVSGTTMATGTFTSGMTGPLTVTDDDVSGSYNVTLSAASGVVPCFLTGTMIATADGEKPVESLKIGDLVLTDAGEAVPVRWIGQRTISARFADPVRTIPVRITAGALGDNQPTRDLLISPDHAVLVEETLVNAGALINGATILREVNMPSTFVYYHIEVDEHKLILAEGLAAETFINHVDRMSFDNWTEHAAIFGGAPEKPEMAYPRVKSARQLPRSIRALMLERMSLASRAAA